MKINEIPPLEHDFTEVLKTLALIPKMLYFYGKLPENMYFTSVYVEVKPEGISVRSYDRFCKEFDSFRISPDGTVTDIFRSDEFKFYEY